jgi:hypothetical protein
LKHYAWSGIELVLNGQQVRGQVIGEADALGKVVAQQSVDVSMSSGGLISGDLVLPRRLVGCHRPMYDVDEVALEDSSCPAAAFVWCVASE